MSTEQLGERGPFPVPGGDTLPFPQPTVGQPPYGSVVVVLNVHGVAQAFGPYSEEEAHEIGDFTCNLLPTWVFHLDQHESARYGWGESDKPVHVADRPTRPRRWPIKDAADFGSTTAVPR